MALPKFIMKKAFILLVILLVIIAAYSAVDKTIIIREPGLKAPTVVQPVAPAQTGVTSDAGAIAAQGLSDAMEREQNQFGLLVFGLIIGGLAILLITAIVVMVKNGNRHPAQQQISVAEPKIPRLKRGDKVILIDEETGEETQLTLPAKKQNRLGSGRK